MKEKKNQYNKQYSNFQYRSRDISLFLLITRIFGRKGEQLLRAIYTIESYHKSVGEGRISTLRSVSTYTESRLVFQSVSLPVYSERNDRGGKRSVVCMSRAGTGRHPLSTFHQHVGHSNPSKYDWLFERWPRSLDDRSL